MLVDAGGVLFNNISEETDFLALLAQRYHAQLPRLRRALDQHDHDYETDAAHVHQVLMTCLELAGGDCEDFDGDHTDELYLARVEAYPSCFEQLRALRALHPELVLALANNEAAHWDEVKNARYEHLALFDVIGSSWHLRAVKPTDEYFHRLLAAVGCDADEVLLADDNPDIVRAARLFGLNAVHIPSPPSLFGVWDRL
ncbi:HAD family hydrolase [Saccharopolyspora sp. NPDC000359]|uniref:HAD family hydrolase n=1 Tax=Saccharopolyspora sp. NPDC000359 TaxID=3154251 RepID=UPI00332B9F95